MIKKNKPLRFNVIFFILFYFFFLKNVPHHHHRHELLILSPTTLSAKSSQDVQIISDDETEEFVYEWVEKFFKYGKLAIKPKIYLANTTEVNAAATYGGVIIVNTGLISKCKNASQLLGVLAHETGHIAGGHLAKSSVDVQTATTPSILTLILGGAATLVTGNPGALVAGLYGGAHIFYRKLLTYTRAHEESADAFAVQCLTALKLPVEGLVEFFEILRRNYSTGEEDPYLSTHPPVPNRKEKIVPFQGKFKLNPRDEERFTRIRGKLNGFLKSSVEISRLYPEEDQSIEADYARLINAYLHDGTADKAKKALQKIDMLIQKIGSNQYAKDDTYLIELKGQFCFETGEIGRSLQYFEQVLNKKPKSLTIRLLYAQALLEHTRNHAQQHQDNLKKVLQELEKLIAQNDQMPLVWRLMGTAYGRLGKEANAAACLAEEALQMGQIKLAEAQANRGIKADIESLRQRCRDILNHIRNIKEN